jgi:hypothetical protein
LIGGGRLGWFLDRPHKTRISEGQSYHFIDWVQSAFFCPVWHEVLRDMLNKPIGIYRDVCPF